MKGEMKIGDFVDEVKRRSGLSMSVIRQALGLNKTLTVMDTEKQKMARKIADEILRERKFLEIAIKARRKNG